MKRINILSGLAVVLAIALFNPATLNAGPGKGNKDKAKHAHKVKKHSPPPFAPAHGYKHKHDDGVELTYDSNVGAYLVVGKTDIYYQNGLFVSFSDGAWKVTASLGGEWREHQEGEIPVKLWESKKKPAAAIKRPIGVIKSNNSKGKKK